MAGNLELDDRLCQSGAVAVLQGSQRERSLLIFVGIHREDQGCHDCIDFACIGVANADNAVLSGIHAGHDRAALGRNQGQKLAVIAQLHQTIGAVHGVDGHGDGLLAAVHLDPAAVHHIGPIRDGDGLGGTRRNLGTLNSALLIRHGNGGDRALVGLHIHDDGGPDVLSEVAQLHGIINVIVRVVDQSVELVGLAGEGGQVQCSVIAHHQGGILLGSKEVLGQGAVGPGVAEGIVVVVGEDIGPPDRAGIVHQIEHIAPVFTAVVAVELRTGGGHGHEIIVVIAHGVSIDVILAVNGSGPDQRAVADVVDPVTSLGGVELAVGQAMGIVVIVGHVAVGTGDHLARIIHFKSGIAGVQDVEILTAGDGCGGDGILLQLGSCHPGLAGGHIPGKEVGHIRAAVVPDQNALHLDIQHGDVDGTLGIDGGVGGGGHGDDRTALTHAGDEALAADSGDGRIAGGEEDLPVFRMPGSHTHGELVALIPEDLHMLLIQLHGHNLAAGIIPVVGGVAPVREDQGGDLAIEIAVVGPDIGTIGGIPGVDAVELIGLGIGGRGIVAHQIQVAVVGVILQAVIAGGIGIDIAHLGHGTDFAAVQGEGVEVGIIAVAGHEELAVPDVGQGRAGIVACGKGAELGDNAGHTVDADEHTLGAVDGVQGVDDAVFPVVGHVGKQMVQVRDLCHLEEVIAGSGVEVFVAIHEVDVGANSGGRHHVDLAGKPAIVADQLRRRGGPVTDIPLPEGGAVVEHFGHGFGGADGLLELVGGLVHGVVHHLDDELVAVDRIQGDLHLDGGARRGILIRAAQGQLLPAGHIIDDHTGHMLVVGHGQPQNVLLRIHHHGILHDDGGGVIDDKGHFQGICLGPVAVAELHQGIKFKPSTLALLHVGGEIQLEGLGHIQPAAQSRIVVGRIHRAALLIEELLAGGGVGNGRPMGTGVADQAEVKAPEVVAPLQIDGVALRHILTVGLDGVAAEVVGHIGVVAVGDAHAVDVGGGPVGLPLLFTGEIGGVAGLIEHGGLMPAAVVGQHGNAQGGQDHTLGIRHGLGKDKCLDIGTCGIFVVQPGLLVIGQADGHLHGDGRAASHLHGNRTLLQQQMYIVGIDQTIAAEIRIVDHALGHCVQQELGISPIGEAVPVQVIGGQIGSFQNLAVDPELHLGIHGAGQGVEIPDALLALEDVLGKNIAGEAVGNGLVGEVVQIEGKAVHAGAVGIVAQLRLDFAVILALDGDVDGACHGVGHIAQAGALLHDGVVAAVVAVDEGLGGGHQQGLGQCPVGHSLGIDAVLLQVLEHQGGHAGHLGGGHGGAGHELVAGAGGIHAVDGVDVAAGSRDLRLQLQIAGHTPGGEAADGLELGIVIVAGDGAHHGDDAGVVGLAAVGGPHLAHPADILGVVLGDGDHGNGVFQTCQVHVDHAGLVVVYHHGGRAQSGGVVGLLQEGDLAAADEDDPAGHLDARVVFGISEALQEHKAIVGAGGLHGGVQGGEGHISVLHIAVTQGFQVAKGVLACDQVAGEIAVIVHGGHSQGIGVGTGSTAGGEVHIVVEEIAVVGILRPVAVVAAGDGHDGVSLGQAVEELLVQGIIAVGPARQRRAQGQVNGIRSQDQRVLHGGEDVGVVGTAVGTEDLHGQDLGIGCIARHAGLPRSIHKHVLFLNEAVGGGDTCHMGAVLTLAVVVVGHVQAGVDIVIAKCGLGIDVQILGGQGNTRLLLTGVGVQLRQNCGNVIRFHQVVGLSGGGSRRLHRMEERILRKGLMIGVQAGVNNGDAHARAGIARLPGLLCAGHLAGNGHLGLVGAADGCHLGLVAVLLHHPHNAVQLLNRRNRGAGHIGGDHIGGEGQIPHHIQLPALQDLALDGCGQGFLTALQAVAVADRVSVRQTSHYMEACIDGGCLFQLNGNADHFVHVFFCLCGVIHLSKRQLGGNGIIADLLDAEGQPGIRLHRPRRGQIARNQHKCQQQAQTSAKKVALFHNLSSLFGRSQEPPNFSIFVYTCQLPAKKNGGAPRLRFRLSKKHVIARRP